MLGRLVLLLTLVPLAELFLILTVHRQLSEHLGGREALGVTIGTIVLTGFAGALLARSQGVAALRTLQATLARREFPGQALLDAGMIVLGGAMLLMPGYLTDLFGISLLVPASRAYYRHALERWIRRKIAIGEAQVRATAASFVEPGSARPTHEGEVVIEETFMPPTGEAPERP
jgi:UPF0716 protein FxsA